MASGLKKDTLEKAEFFPGIYVRILCCSRLSGKICIHKLKHRILYDNVNEHAICVGDGLDSGLEGRNRPSVMDAKTESSKIEIYGMGHALVINYSQ